MSSPVELAFPDSFALQIQEEEQILSVKRERFRKFSESVKRSIAIFFYSRMIFSQPFRVQNVYHIFYLQFFLPFSAQVDKAKILKRIYEL
jgi:hypothetical protein